MEEPVELDRPVYRIGCVFSPKKLRTFLTPSLLSAASARSIHLVPVEPDRPLPAQGPFHLLLHKLPLHPDWTASLLSFSAAHAAVPVVDRPEAIARLRLRYSMLDAASGIQASGEEVLAIPRQVVLENGGLSADGVGFPAVAKPLVAEGASETHDMALVFRNEGLCKLKLPVVLQEFVNNGGILFKVYVIGDYVKCVKRKSLPDVSVELLDCEEDMMPFSRVSNTPYLSQDNQIGQHLESAKMPSSGFVEDVARGLREALGLKLFNFDLIRDMKAENRYLVIDINYFPGYEKIPSYEEIFTDFLLNAVRENTNHG